MTFPILHLLFLDASPIKAIHNSVNGYFVEYQNQAAIILLGRNSRHFLIRTVMPQKLRCQVLPFIAEAISVHLSGNINPVVRLILYDATPLDNLGKTGFIIS